MSSAASVPPPLASALLASFASFLTVALHSLLYHRGLYPPASFLLARAYNLPVHQSRHPAVCAWIRDAVAAASVQVRAARVRAIALVVHEPRAHAVVERWLFDLSAFPADALAPGDAPDPGPDAPDPGPDAPDLGPDPGPDQPPHRHVNWADVAEALRAALRRLADAAEALPRPPDDCIFTLALELRDEAPAPIHHPQLWIPSEPRLQPPTASNPDQPRALAGSATTPVRSVQIGPLFFECWVERASRKPHDHTPGSQPAGEDESIQSPP